MSARPRSARKFGAFVAAVPIDPAADPGGIGGGDHPRRLGSGIFIGRIRQLRGVEAEHRARRDADLAVRADAERERAGGKGGFVDHDALSELAQIFKVFHKDVAAPPALASI